MIAEDQAIETITVYEVAGRKPFNIFRDSEFYNYMDKAKPVNSQNWEKEVMSSPIPVFVDFWAEWCGPCRMVSPVIEELAGEYAGKINFVKVNVDESNELASKYNVFSIPTLALFNKGQVVAQQVGAASKGSYKNMIDNALSKI